MHKSLAHHKNWRQVPHDCIIYFDVKVLSLFSKFFQLERFAVLSDMHKAKGKENPPKKRKFIWVSFCRSNKFYLSIFGRSFTSNNASKENNRIILRNYREWRGGWRGSWRGWGWWGGVIKMECPIFFQPSLPPQSQFFFRSIVAGDSTGHFVTSNTIQPASNHLQSWGPFLESPETFRAHFGWHNSLCIFKTIASRGTKLGSYFNFHSLYNISKDQPNEISVSRCYEWFFGSDKFSGLLKNGPRDIGASFWRNPTSIVFHLLKPLSNKKVSISHVKTRHGNSVFLELSCLNLVRNSFFSALTKRIMVYDMWAKNEYIKYIALTCRLSTSHFSKHSIFLSDPKMVKETVWIIGFLFTQSNSFRSFICPFSLWIVNQGALVR